MTDMVRGVRDSIAYRRAVRCKAIKRKKGISRAVYGFDWYRYDGQYSKGKIHCGCGLCKFGRKYNLPTFQDVKRSMETKYAIDEWLENSGG